VLRTLWHALVAAMSTWHQGKLFIEHLLAIDHDALHVIVGVLLWLVVGLLLRRPLSSWWSWLWVLAAIAWNEAVDLWVEQWPDPGQQYGEGAKDLILTMLLPAVMTIAVRRRPDLFRRGVRRR